MQLYASFRLAFASAPWLNHLTSLHNATRRPVLQKVRRHTLSGATPACKHTVSGSLSLPSRGPFHLSLTVLYAIGHQDVFSLRRWSSHIPTRLHVSCGTLDTRHYKFNFAYKTVTLFRPAFQPCSTIKFKWLCRSEPQKQVFGLGCFPFAHHYLGNRLFSFSSSGYLDVSVPRVPLVHLWIQCTILQHYLQWVSSFGDLRIAAYLQLPVAYRS